MQRYRLSMHPERGILCTYRSFYSLYTRPDDPSTLTCQSDYRKSAPRDPLHGLVKVNRINKETFHKELKGLVKIWVLTLLQSQYGTPIFIIPKKEGTVMLIIDYHRINKILVGNPYPLPRTGDTMNQLWGIQYATTLDLNMEYYTIRI